MAADTTSNEITVIPTLLGVLQLQPRVVTIDTVGCQPAIAHHISTGAAEYVLTVQANQVALTHKRRILFRRCTA